MHLSLQKLALTGHRGFLIREKGTGGTTFMATGFGIGHSLTADVNGLAGGKLQSFPPRLKVLVLGISLQAVYLMVDSGNLVLMCLEIAVGLEVVEHGRTTSPPNTDSSGVGIVELPGIGIEKPHIAMVFHNENTPHLTFHGLCWQMALQYPHSLKRQCVGIIIERIVQPAVRGHRRIKGMELSYLVNMVFHHVISSLRMGLP